jgi:hypothetical protein
LLTMAQQPTSIGARCPQTAADQRTWIRNPDHAGQGRSVHVVDR